MADLALISPQTKDENHVRFLGHLRASNEAVAHVAQWMASHGRDVLIKGTKYASEHSAWRDFADAGDLFILKRIEVKRLSVDFTGVDDWPFGNNFIVCAKHAFDRAKDKPEAFVILSQNMEHCAVVPVATSNFWYEEERTDSRYTGDVATQVFYFCPIDRVQFRQMEGQ